MPNGSSDMALTWTPNSAAALDPGDLSASELKPSQNFVTKEPTPVVEMGEIDYESLPTDKLSAHLLAGGAAGVMEHCVMYPVDCIKTRLMVLSPKVTYSGLSGAFQTIIKHESPRALFRGIGLVATGAGPAHALYFSAYEVSKKRLSNKYNSIVAQGIAGGVASVFHDGFMNPVEVVKQRLQVCNSPYKGVVHCATTILQKEGAVAFYRSYTTQLGMNIPFQVVHFIGYEKFQDIFNPTRRYSPISHMLSGAGAGTCAAIVTTPLDVARTFLNTHEQGRTMAKQQRIHGMYSALKQIYKIRGLTGYFRGVTARVVFQMPSTAISWSVYEFFKFYLGLKEEDYSGSRRNHPANPPI